MVLLYCFAGVIPLIILFRCFRIFDKRLRKCRISYAVASMFAITYDIVLIGLILAEKITYGEHNYFVTIIPIVLTFVSIISYYMGKKPERRIEADIAAENAYDIMDLRKRGANNINFK